MTANIERLRSIEANAWSAYRKARERAARKPNAATKLAAIDEGNRWRARNDDLHATIHDAERASMAGRR